MEDDFKLLNDELLVPVGTIYHKKDFNIGVHVFLAVIIDVFSRRCIGWELSRHIDTDLTLNALRNAFRTRKEMI